MGQYVRGEIKTEAEEPAAAAAEEECVVVEVAAADSGKRKATPAKSPAKKAKVAETTVDSDEEEDEDPYTCLTPSELNFLALQTVTSPRPSMSRCSADKITVEDGDPNTYRTLGVVLHVDGRTYSLPIAFLQKMNKYEYDDGDRVVCAPYKYWNTCAQLVGNKECVSDRDCKTIQKKTGLGLGQSVVHPCPGESRQTVLNVKI